MPKCSILWNNLEEHDITNATASQDCSLYPTPQTSLRFHTNSTSKCEMASHRQQAYVKKTNETNTTASTCLGCTKQRASKHTRFKAPSKCSTVEVQTFTLATSPKTHHGVESFWKMFHMLTKLEGKKKKRRKHLCVCLVGSSTNCGEPL